MLYSGGIVILISITLAAIGFIVLHRLPRLLSYAISTIICIVLIAVGRTAGFLTGMLTWCILTVLLAAYYNKDKFNP